MQNATPTVKTADFVSKRSSDAVMQTRKQCTRGRLCEHRPGKKWPRARAREVEMDGATGPYPCATVHQVREDFWVETCKLRTYSRQERLLDSTRGSHSWKTQPTPLLATSLSMVRHTDSAWFPDIRMAPPNSLNALCWNHLVALRNKM